MLKSTLFFLVTFSVCRWDSVPQLIKVLQWHCCFPWVSYTTLWPGRPSAVTQCSPDNSLTISLPPDLFPCSCAWRCEQRASYQHSDHQALSPLTGAGENPLIINESPTRAHPEATVPETNARNQVQIFNLCCIVGVQVACLYSSVSSSAHQTLTMASLTVE